MKDVMILTGAGQIGMAIARRMGYGKKVVIGDKNLDNSKAIAKIMNDAGFDAVPLEMDLSERGSILNLIAEAQKHGEISMLVNSAGVSPSQAPIEAILKVDLYGTAVLLEEVGKVIKEGGAGVTISSQSGYRMPALSPEADEQMASTHAEDLRPRAASVKEYQRHTARLSDGKALQCEARDGRSSQMGAKGRTHQLHFSRNHRDAAGY